MKSKNIKHKFLLIIPARAGSKGIINKNLRYVGKHKLIDYSIKLVKKIKLEGIRIISTDIDDLINDKEKFKPILVPFKRPNMFSSDKSTMYGVVNHSLKWLKKNYKMEFENIIIIQPTNPFRKTSIIQEAIKTYVESSLNSLVGVSEVWQHPAEIILKQDNIFKKIMNEREGRRQEFSEVQFISGALYIISSKKLKETKNFLNDDTYFYKLNEETSLDIDNEFQMMLADSFALKKGWKF